MSALVRAIWNLFNGPGKPRWLNWVSHVIPGFLIGLGDPGFSMAFGLGREIEQGAEEARQKKPIGWFDHGADYVSWFLGAWLAGFLTGR